MADTGTVRRIALAPWTGGPPVDTPVAAPDVEDLGSNIEWDEPWLTFGGQPLGVGEQADIGYLDEDSVAIKPREESLELRAPLDQNKADEILFKNGVESVSWTSYSATEDVLAVSSGANTDMDPAVSGEIQEGLTIQWYSMCLEITGLELRYFPKVRVKITNQEGGVKKPWKVDFQADVYGYEGDALAEPPVAAVPSGMQRISFTTPA